MKRSGMVPWLLLAAGLCLPGIAAAESEEAPATDGEAAASPQSSALDEEPGRQGALQRLKERYPGAEENEYERYPMGLGIERQPDQLWVLPILSYTSDFGAGYGLLISWKVSAPQGEPSHALRTTLFYSALDAGRVRLQWERTPGSSGVHLLSDLSWTQMPLHPYFGVGNTVYAPPSSLAMVSGVLPPDAEFYSTRYRARQSYASLIAQKGIFGEKKRLFGAVRLRQYTFDPWDRAAVMAQTGEDPGEGYTNLLEVQAPYGSGGGFSPLVQIGGMSDTRKANVAPASGTFHEVSVRGMGFVPWDAAEGQGHAPVYGGVNVTLRRYGTILGNWVVASRLVGDVMFGDVPLHDLGIFGASDPYFGLGGTLAGRGLYLSHFVGKIKVLWGPEIRWTPISRPTDAGYFDLSFAVFADSGRVWADWEKDGEGAGLHTGLGGGVRAVWSKRVLVRLDVAKALQDDDPLGVYLVFDHPY